MNRLRNLEIEKQVQPTTTSIITVSGLALLFAFTIASFIFLAHGVNPIHALGMIFKGALGSTFGLTETVRRAIPLLLVGVGLTVAFRAQFWNIGAEGQILMGAIAASWVALFLNLPSFLLIPAMLFFGFAGGAIWGIVAAFLKTRYGVNEIITTLLMNYIAAQIVFYLIHGPWKGDEKWGFAYTNDFPQAAWFETIGSTRIPWLTLILGVIAAGLLYVLVAKTTIGFKIRIMGENPEAAKYAGISSAKTAFTAMLISGGLAGLAGVGEVAGIHHMLRHPDHISLGYGYTAIIVAWLARTNPLAAIVTAFLFGAMLSGGDVIKVSLGMPFQVINVINGLILFCLIAGERLMHYRIIIGERRRL